MTQPPAMIDSRSDRFDEAAAWFAKWRCAPESGLTDEEMERWVEWGREAANRAAYESVKRVAEFRHVIQAPPRPGSDELAADEFDGSVPVSRWFAETRRAPIRNGSKKAWPWIAVALAATLAGVAVIGSRFLHPRSVAESPQIVATHQREKKQITLTDGSRVFLGDDTRIAVQYGPCRRTIVLIRGEALFSVAHNPSCPFSVIAGHGLIRAVGTRFSVRRTLDHVTVAVADGIVDVHPHREVPEKPASSTPAEVAPLVRWTPARLVRGQEVTLQGSEHRSAIESADPGVATGWLEGRREYRKEPLAYVVADINRYFGKRIVISDPALGELQFTGRVYESQVTDWLHALETIFPVSVHQPDGDNVVIASVEPHAEGPASDLP